VATKLVASRVVLTSIELVSQLVIQEELEDLVERMSEDF
jgi:hypothetical protein